MILFLARPGQINHITLCQDRYVIPRRDGHVLLGSTLERTGFVKATTAEAKEELYRTAVEMFPILKRTPIEDHWAGLRPGSPSGIPYIGAYPGIEGLYLNAGHFRNGVVTGPASARLAADLMLGRVPIADPAPYALDAER
jgi:glycine oxidase